MCVLITVRCAVITDRESGKTVRCPLISVRCAVISCRCAVITVRGVLIAVRCALIAARCAVITDREKEISSRCQVITTGCVVITDREKEISDRENKIMDREKEIFDRERLLARVSEHRTFWPQVPFAPLFGLIVGALCRPRWALLITSAHSTKTFLANSEQSTANSHLYIRTHPNPHQPQSENPDHTGQGFPKATG